MEGEEVEGAPPGGTETAPETPAPGSGAGGVQVDAEVGGSPPAETETPTPGEPSEGEAPPAPSEPEDYDLLGEHKPGWLDTLERVKKIEGKQSFKVSKAEIDNLPPAAQQVVSNLRNLALKERQTTVEAKRELEAARATLAADRDRMLQEVRDERAKMLSLFTQNPEMQKLLESVPSTENIDPYTREGIAALTQSQTAQFLKAFQENIKKQAEEQDRATAQLQAEARLTARKAEVRNFIKQHPDFDDYKSDIIELRKRSGMTISTEEAYEFLKGKKTLAEERATSEARRGTRQRVGKPNGATHPPPEMPKGLSSFEMIQWMRKNPDAAAVIKARIKKKGVSYG